MFIIININVILLIILFIIVACYSFFFNRFYILNSLIILEMVILLCIIVIVFSLGVIIETKYLFLIILCFAACEAAIGLSLLVRFIRLRGNNLIRRLALNTFFAKNSWNSFFTKTNQYFYLVKWWFNSRCTFNNTDFNWFVFINTLHFRYYKQV